MKLSPLPNDFEQSRNECHPTLLLRILKPNIDHQLQEVGECEMVSDMKKTPKQQCSDLR